MLFAMVKKVGFSVLTNNRIKAMRKLMENESDYSAN